MCIEQKFEHILLFNTNLFWTLLYLHLKKEYLNTTGKKTLINWLISYLFVLPNACIQFILDHFGFFGLMTEHEWYYLLVGADR